VGEVNGILVLVLLVSIVMVAAIAFYEGTLQDPVTVETQTVTTTTPAPPSSITISGGVSTTNIGTSFNNIQFVSQKTGVSYPGGISGGQYSATLYNRDSYTVKVHWTGALGVSGDCVAGALPLYYQFDPRQALTMNWSC